MNTVEMRAHDSWIAAKQAERRLEDAKSEASILRKKLTGLTENFTVTGNAYEIIIVLANLYISNLAI